MGPLLTIGVPTFERADLLDRQLRTLHGQLSRIDEPIEVLVSDNASGDDTGEVIERWSARFDGPFRAHRQRTNIGPIRNIDFCMEQASANHVWVVSDDDRLAAGAVRFVVDAITARPDLALIVLNHGAHHVSTGAVDYDRCYPFDRDRASEDGRKLFGQLLLHHQGGVTLTTALVYRRDLLRRSIEQWPDGLDNYAVQTYMSGYCAQAGPVLASATPYVSCALGEHWFIADESTRRRFRFDDKPAMYAQLAGVGYRSVLRKKALRSTIHSVLDSGHRPGEIRALTRKLGSLAHSLARRTPAT